MLETLGKIIEKDSTNIRVQEHDISEISENEYSIDKSIILEPDIEIIKESSLDSIIKSNLENTKLIEDVDEMKTRPLTEEERENVQNRVGMSDETLDRCTIDENGKVYLKCIRADLDGEQNEVTGIRYKRKVIDVNGVKIEVIVPEFESFLDVQLSDENISASDSAQAKECNTQLKEAIENDPELRSKFSDEQIRMIEKGYTPRGFTWHHDASVGKMQLVESDVHSKTRHTGGKAIWGGGQDNR